MVFNATFNNISAISSQLALLVEETGVPRENHRPVTCHWQTLSNNVYLGQKFEDTKGVMRGCKLERDRWHKGQKYEDTKGVMRRCKLERDRWYKGQKYEDTKGVMRRCKLERDRWYKGQKFEGRRQIQRPPHDQCTCMRAMPFIYRGNQRPVPKGLLDWKWLTIYIYIESSLHICANWGPGWFNELGSWIT